MMFGPVSKEDVDLLVGLTGQNREKVVRVLLRSCGDVNIALRQLEMGQSSKPSAAASREMSDSNAETASEAGGSEEVRMVRLPIIMEGSNVPSNSPAISAASGSRSTIRDESSRISGSIRIRNPDNDYLTLKVLRPFQEPEHNEIHFRVKRTTQLGKLKKSYSERINVPLFLLRFLFDGRRIENEHTPEFLEMESGDFIEVYNELGNGSSGGISTAATNNSTTTIGSAAEPEKQLPVESPRRTGSGNKRMSRRGTNEEICLDVAVDEEEEECSSKEKRPRKEALVASPRQETDMERLQADLLSITHKYETLVKKLKDKVECPVCLDVPKGGPVPVCSNGHIVCAKCVRLDCPTCRVRMTNSTSLLAVTVIENIDHSCDWEGCSQAYPLLLLSRHMSRCQHRKIKCPGLDCTREVPLKDLTAHAISCCVERKEIKQLRLPHQFTFMMSEDLGDLSGESQNFNWNLEGIKFDNKVFFLKVTRKARRASWYFLVQEVGGEEECSAYTLNMVVLKGTGVLDGKYSMNYCGDVCPIDVTSIEEAEEKGLCLALKDGVMGKILTKNSNTGDNEFCVLVDIVKSSS